MTFSEFRADYFSRWQKRLVVECWGIFALITVISLLFSAHYYFNNMIPEERLLSYMIVEVLVPFVLQVFSIILMQIVLHSKKISLKYRNRWVVITMFNLMAILSIFHCRYEVLFVCPWIAVMIAAILSDKHLMESLASAEVFVFVISSFVWSSLFSDLNEFEIMARIIIEAFVCFGFFFLAIGCYHMENMHIRFLYQSYSKQKRFVRELRLEPLTRLYNRTAYALAVNNCIKNHKKTNEMLFQVLLDLDSFKSINDKYGHSGGDAVLISLADLLKKILGSTRLAFRYGGDEFVLLFRGKNISEVVCIVEQIREEFHSIEFDFMPESEHCSMSIGIAMYKDGWTSQKWFDAADSAAYQAKSNGKNRYEICQDID